MPWHYRHVKSARNAKSLRTTVVFQRQELMWEPKGGPFSNPYTGQVSHIPAENHAGALVGPNILDAVNDREKSYR